MGDEKTHADDTKKQDAPPPTAEHAPPEVEHDPGKGHKTEDKQKHEDKKPKPAEATPPDPAKDPKKQAEQATQLQQTVGNQQANRLMRAARDAAAPPGLPVSHPDDKAEKEAEQVAKKVTEEQPPHPRDHPAPAHGDPTAITGDPHEVTGDPEQQRGGGTLHRLVDNRHQPAKPGGTPAPSTKGPDRSSPTSVFDHPGPGEPIPQPTRGILERKLHADLRHVVVHHDAKADAAVRALHARAVTRGNHIWLASDASPHDLHLMAHEVAHVLQGDSHTVRRQTDTSTTPTPPPPPPTKYSGPEGSVDVGPTTDAKDSAAGPKKTIEVDHVLYVPQKSKSGVDFRGAFARAGRQVVPRGDTKQTANWLKGIGKTTIRSEIEKVVKSGTAYLPAPDPTKPPPKDPPTGAKFILEFNPGPVTRPPNAPGAGTAATHQGVLIGSVDELADHAALPNWNSKGNFHTYDVDHVLEMQVSGEDKIDNYWLWDAVANQSGGAALNIDINNKVQALLNAAKAIPGLPRAQAARADTANWRIRVGKLTDGLAPIKGQPDVYWTRKEVEDGNAAKQLKKVDDNRARELGLYPGGSQRFLTIITGGKSGAVVRIPWANDQKEAKESQLAGVTDIVLPYFKIKKVTFDGAKGQLVGEATNRLGLFSPRTFKPFELTALGAAPSTVATLDGYGLAQKAGFFEFKGLSPIEVTEAELRAYSGLYVRGVLKPSIPLLSAANISVVISGGDISLEKSFSAKEIKLPGPVKVTQGGITVSVGTKGLEVSGDVDFTLGSVAKGSLAASLDSKLAFGLSGKLDFEKGLFEPPAQLTFTYLKTGQDYQWGIGGTLGIGPKQIPGIKKAVITASYQNQVFSAKGDAELAIPGIEKGSLDVMYSEKGGFSLGGKFALSKDVPGIESGEVEAKVAKLPPGNKWKLAASGTAKPKIPGIATTLQVSYDDGAFTIHGTAAYSKGMASGTLEIGVTNQALGPNGQPQSTGKPGSQLRVYGGGSLTVKIAPWLQGTVGVKLDEKGNLKLQGKVAIPDTVDIFPAKEIKKTLFTIGIDIPIVGVSVAGQRIGIFATVHGGLEASAGIGPGQLRQLSLEVDYEPAHEENTKVEGKGQLYIPAHAGLRLYVDGGVGLGIPIVSAEAGLEVGGELGIAGAVQADLDVVWSKSKGLTIDAVASLSAEPKFTFDVQAYVDVSASLGPFHHTIYEHRWKLAKFEYGSGLRVGVHAPVHYEQGKPFKFDLNDIKFDVPKVDPQKILGDLVHRVTSG
jgi:hypothetical protein